MLRFAPRLALVLIAAVLSGCFQISSVLTVRPDGSATLRDQVTLSGIMLMAMQEALEEGDETPDEVFDRLGFEERAAELGEGVRLDSYEPTDEGYVAVYAIDDVRALRYSMPDAMGDGDDDDDNPLTDGPDFTFLFDDGDPARLRIVVPKPEETPEKPQDGEVMEDEEDEIDTARMIGMLRSMMGDARMTMAVEIEGAIVETDANHVDGSTVTLYDLPLSAIFDVMEENPDMMGSEPPPDGLMYEILADVEGVQLEQPGTITVRFR